MKVLSAVPLREVHAIVDDQLVTQLAAYLPRQEVETWVSRPALRDVTVQWHNENSWRCSATVTNAARA